MNDEKFASGSDWRTVELPDGRTVEFVDARAVSVVDDLWTIDVAVLIDGQNVGVHRVQVQAEGEPDDR